MECMLLDSFLLQHILGLMFRETEGLLAIVRLYYLLVHVPDHSTLSR